MAVDECFMELSTRRRGKIQSKFSKMDIIMSELYKKYKSYCCGFIFSSDLKYVLLIKKIKPEWQKDKLNGVGGSVEDLESAFSAIKRECNEETSLEIENLTEFLGYREENL